MFIIIKYVAVDKNYGYNGSLPIMEIKRTLVSSQTFESTKEAQKRIFRLIEDELEPIKNVPGEKLKACLLEHNYFTYLSTEHDPRLEDGYVQREVIHPLYEILQLN